MKKIYLFLLSVVISATVIAQTDLDIAVDFSVTLTTGETIELFPILDEGKLVVLDFFHVNCNGCKTYSPEMEKAYQDFGCNTGNVVFIGINKWDALEDVIAFDEEYGVTFPTASGDAYGGGLTVFNQYGILGTPTLIIIDPDRTILKKLIWPPDQATIVAEVESFGGVQKDCSSSINSNLYQNLSFRIAPNPAKEYINLFLSEPINGRVDIEISNLLGKKVKTVENLNSRDGDLQHKIALPLLNEGIYFLTIKVDGKITATQKLFIK